MKRATILIMDTLRAMGAAPMVTTDDTGNDVIKINAPEIDASGARSDEPSTDGARRGEGAQKWPD